MAPVVHIMPAASGGWIDLPYLCDSRFLLQDDLRVAGHPGAELRWEAKGLVKSICVQWLGASEDSSHGFHSCADNVVVGIL